MINTRKNATDAGDTQDEVIELNMATGSQGVSVEVYDNLSSNNMWIINATNADYFVLLSFSNTDHFAGSYMIATYDEQIYIRSKKTYIIDKIIGTCDVTENNGVIQLSGTFIGESEKVYQLNLTYGTTTAVLTNMTIRMSGVMMIIATGMNVMALAIVTLLRLMRLNMSMAMKEIADIPVLSADMSMKP